MPSIWSCVPSFAPAYDDLKKAASKGDADKAARLLRYTPADPFNTTHPSALQVSARYGYLEIAKALVKAGADINRVADGTPLTDAAACGRFEIVKFFLENRGDVSVGKDGATAIHMAARNGHFEVLQMLLGAAADKTAAVSAPDAKGQTPLHFAATMPHGGEGVVKYLLDNGSDPTATDKEGNTPLHLASMVGNAGTTQLLAGAVGGEGMGAINSRKRTAMHLAAKYGRAGALRTLMERQAPVPGADVDGSTPLHHACQSLLCSSSEQFSMAKALLDAGVNPATKDKAGNVARMYTTSPQLQELLKAAEATAPPPAEEAAPPAKAEAVVAPTKAEQIALAMQEGLRRAGAQGEISPETEELAPPPVSWLAKQALRTPTSEGGHAGDWKLGTKASTSIQE